MFSKTYILKVLFFSGFLYPLTSMELLLSGGFGWSHYQAKDLNTFFNLLEKRTHEGGFNSYEVEKFDGHGQLAWALGVKHAPWTFALATEYWKESFKQSEIALGDPNRNESVTCAQLKDPAYIFDGSYGCVEAKESFFFLPITLELSYSKDIGKRFFLGFGYGIGMMLGDATISVSTDYFGNSGIDDAVVFSIDPGLNVTHKIFINSELRLFSLFGIQVQTGYRISKLKHFVLSEKKGESEVFAALFDNPQNGDKLYLKTYDDPTLSELPQEIVIGNESDAGKASTLHPVQGDFSGWFIHLKCNIYWRFL